MERKKLKKRNAMIDRAERTISKKGYWEMTMDEVAAEADVAKGTLYLYFASKESLGAAVAARIVADMNRAFLEKLDGARDGRGRIRAIISAVIAWSDANPEKSRVLQHVMSLKFKDASDPCVQEYFARMDEQLEIISDCYRAAIDEGVVRPDLDPAPAAIFIRMAFWSVINPSPSYEIAMEAHGIGRDTLISTAIDLVAHAMYTDNVASLPVISTKPVGSKV